MFLARIKKGQWVEITHRSGDKIRIQLSEILRWKLELAVDDPDRNFHVNFRESVQERSVSA